MKQVLNRIFSNKINSDGYFYIVVSVVLAILFFVFSWTLGMLGIVIAGFMFFFFRDPIRVVPIIDFGLLSPADGLVLSVGKEKVANNEGDVSEMNFIRVFLRVYDVHVNRLPCDGKVLKTEHCTGRFYFADDDDQTIKKNEKQETFLDTKYGEVILVQQVGVVARRIVCYVKEDQELMSGDRLGIMKFGSSFTLYFSDRLMLNVQVGQTVVAGETIIAIDPSKSNINDIQYKKL
ncbi:MAG: phosphatidylserine decarboxylase proenzyme [Candidatus Xenolissoclinum pacificiensis L6]|uniref:Phosphatidylserine decarboxylase proenzyme n=1 Tax=Candidatus Xenolissoclinum pacificiensis L6 TaxID=1401685 RepID=W2UZV6_9RICK|nr:MAG: phosphatidylserine decarboxylase proenzyme [Candidatus Xenolissoclinum pacificiensis L6]